MLRMERIYKPDSPADLVEDVARTAAGRDAEVDLGPRPPETEPLTRAAYDLAQALLSHDDAVKAAAEEAYNQAVVNFTINYLNTINEMTLDIKRNAVRKLMLEERNETKG